MTAQERIDAVARLGFTERQARFLATVMTHSGVCLPRQYTAFAGIVYGQKTRRFFARLVADGHASTCRCLHNRAAVYHVHGRALYAAFGVPQSRLRRPVPLAAVVPRLMLLDAVLASPKTIWFDGDEERRLAFPLALDALLHRMPGGAAVGVEPDGTAVIVLVDTASSATSLRALLRRLYPSLDALPNARIRVFYPQDLRPAVKRQPRAVEPVLEGLGLPHEMAAGGRANRLTLEPLPHRYGHLLPLVAGGRVPDLVAVDGERRGEQRPARSRPPSRRIAILAASGRPTSKPAPPHAASPLVSRTW
jgi:hypothetical protein